MSADTFNKLKTLGLSLEQIGGVLEIIEEREKPYLDADAARKANARERVNKWRSKQPVTLHERYRDATETAHASASPAPDLENKQTNKQENKKERASRLPKDWALPDGWRDEAIAAGLPLERVFSEGRKMLNWSLSDKNGAKLDWLATWRNWYQRALESMRKATGPPKPPKPPTLASMWRDEGRKLGILPNEPPHEINRRLDAGFGDGPAPGSNLARRIAGAGSG